MEGHTKVLSRHRFARSDAKVFFQKRSGLILNTVATTALPPFQEVPKQTTTREKNMPRSRRAAPARKPAPARSAPPAPRPQAQAPAPQQQQSGGGGMLAGMASTMAQGFAFGTGSAVAHRAVGAVMGGGGGSGAAAPVEQAQEPAPAAQYSQVRTDPCDMDKQGFGQCLQNNNNDVTACQFAFEALQTCQLEAKKAYN